MVDSSVKSFPGIQAGEETDTSSGTESASVNSKTPKPSIVPLLKSDKRTDPTQSEKDARNLLLSVLLIVDMMSLEEFLRNMGSEKSPKVILGTCTGQTFPFQ